MLTEPQQLFINALKSGEFEQGEGTLRRIDGTWCCLGVACETYRLATGKGKWEEYSTIGRYDFITDDERDNGVMPYVVSHWLGLGGSQNPDLTSEDGSLRASASAFNDGSNIDDDNPYNVKWNFEQIADGFRRLFEEENEEAED